MSANTRLVLILSALVLAAAGVRMTLGPIAKPGAHASLYAAAKSGPPRAAHDAQVEMAVSDVAGGEAARTFACRAWRESC